MDAFSALHTDLEELDRAFRHGPLDGARPNPNMGWVVHEVLRAAVFAHHNWTPDEYLWGCLARCQKEKP